MIDRFSFTTSMAAVLFAAGWACPVGAGQAAVLFASAPSVPVVREVDVNVRRMPYDVPSVSSKSERASVPCQMCGSSVRYDRTYRWDTRNHAWQETTKSVPELCRKCQKKRQAQEKLDRQERALDSEIEYLETKDRIREKRRRAAHLRQGTGR